MKIESRDLRIGNWIMSLIGSDWLPHQVEPTEFLAIHDHPEWVKPIPLTPEILEKAGFGNTITTREGQYVQYGLKSGSWDFMFEFYNNGEPGFYLDMVGIDVFYLHQLQNLYFSLVGQELNIKL